MKKVCKKDKIDFNQAQSLSKAQLKKKSSKKTACKSTFSDVKTVHGKPATGNLKIRIGPEENRTPDLYHIAAN